MTPRLTTSIPCARSSADSQPNRAELEAFWMRKPSWPDAAMPVVTVRPAASAVLSTSGSNPSTPTTASGAAAGLAISRWPARTSARSRSAAARSVAAASRQSMAGRMIKSQTNTAAASRAMTISMRCSRTVRAFHQG